MIKKLLLFSLFTFGFSFLYLCCCGGNFPHFDYQKLTVSFYNQPQLLPNDSMTVFSITPDGVEYFAGTYMPTVSNLAFGTSCPFDGEDGPKYALTQIDITADQDLDVAHPAGTSLNDLFYDLSNDTISTLSDSLPAFFEFLGPYNPLLIGTPFVATDTAQTFILKVRATKSDGSIAEGELMGVKFQ